MTPSRPPRPPLHRTLAFLTAIYERFDDHHGDALSAAIAFYTMLSIAPLLVIAVAIAGVFMDPVQVREALVRSTASVSSSDIARLIAGWLEDSKREGMAAVIAAVMLLWAASKLFLAIQDALNTIWDVRVTRSTGPKNTLDSIKRVAVKRLISFAMVLGTGALLLLMLVIETVASGLDRVVQAWVAGPGLSAMLVLQQLVILFGLLTVVCALIYRVLPDARIAWRDVWIGAVLTATMVLIGTFVLGLYLSHIAPTWLQGALGSAAAFMLWTYYLAQVFLLGASFTRVYADRGGHSVRPEPYAEIRPAEPTA